MRHDYTWSLTYNHLFNHLKWRFWMVVMTSGYGYDQFWMFHGRMIMIWALGNWLIVMTHCSAPWSCNYCLKTSLKASPENQWGNWQSLQVIGVCPPPGISRSVSCYPLVEPSSYPHTSPCILLTLAHSFVFLHPATGTYMPDSLFANHLELANSCWFPTDLTVGGWQEVASSNYCGIQLTTATRIVIVIVPYDCTAVLIACRGWDYL